MWPILLSEPKKSLVENTKTSPLPILGERKYTKSVPKRNKTNENNLLPPKENHIEMSALQKPMCIHKAGRGYFVLDST
jgi:hypothetical protein